MNQASCKPIVFARAGGRCERCDGIMSLSHHHRKKRSQGGEWTPANIVLVCGSGTTGCHGWIENHPNDADEQGWHVRPWEDPECKPVKYRDGDFYLLTEEGGFRESDGSYIGEEDIEGPAPDETE